MVDRTALIDGRSFSAFRQTLQTTDSCEFTDTSNWYSTVIWGTVLVSFRNTTTWETDHRHPTWLLFGY